MTGKRKRSAKDSTVSRKRSKATLADSGGTPGKPVVEQPHDEFDSSQEYKIRAIIDENRTHYRIQWEDDETTGEKYDITWEPKAFANRLAIEDWQETKKRRTAAARGVAQNTTTPRPRGRPRKSVIESSSPPQEPSPEVNGNQNSVEQQEADLEIDESQPTVAGAEGDDEANSALFVPLESPKPREKEQPSVQIPDPPSSYTAGVYQNFSSSEIPESAAPNRRRSSPEEPESSQAAEKQQTQKSRATSLEQASPQSSQVPPETTQKRSPQASQWQPEEGNTSRTTNATTEVSIPQASSSEPSRSVPVNFEPRTNGIVPDSQSLPDSSSFLPSATQTQRQSSSAPEPRGRGRPPKEVTQVPVFSQAQEELSSQPAGASQVATQPSQPQTQSGERLQSSQTSEVNSGSQFHGSSQLPTVAPLTQSSPPQPVERSQGLGGQLSQFASQLDGPLISGQTQDALANSASQASGVAPHRQPSTSRTTAPKVRSQGGEDPASQFTSQVEGLQPESLASQPPNRPGQALAQSQIDEFLNEDQDSLTTAAPAPAQVSPPASIHPRALYSQQPQDLITPSNNSTSNQPTHRAAVTQDPEADIRETTERPDPNHIDLTADTQPSAGQTSSIAVTPLPARNQIAAQRIASSILLGQSSTSPSFGFQTQLPRPYSSTASDPPAQSQNPSSQDHTQSQPHTRRSLGLAFEPSTAPAAFSSQIASSSPVPSAPSQSLNTFPFTRGVPPRPTTPSSPHRPSSQSPGMDHSQSSTSSARAKLKALREGHRAKHTINRRADRSATPTSKPIPPAPETSPPKSAIPPHVAADAPPPNPARLASPLLRAQDRGARSPSAVPAMEALPEITTEEMNTSERYPTLLPQASIAEDDETQRNGSLTSKGTPSQQPAHIDDPEIASVHIIPIHLIGHQRDQYPLTVYHQRELIQDFLNARNPDDRLVEKIHAFVERIRAFCLHPDLNDAETLTQYDVEPSQHAGWDVSCSAKFKFLKTLLDGLREEKMHIVIALGGGRLVDILKTFLIGIHVHATMTDTYDFLSDDSIGALRVTVLVQGADVARMRNADLIIGLDNSFRHDDTVIKQWRYCGSTWCPFATLVVPRSVEDNEGHLSASLTDRARLRALVSGIYKLRLKAGRLQPGDLGPSKPEDSATALVEYFEDDSESKTWPLPGLSSLEDLDSQTENEIDPPVSTASPAVGAKRQRAGSDERAGDDLNKRARVDPSGLEAAVDMPTTVNPQDVELQHISDSVEKLTQATGDGGPNDPAKTDVEKQLRRLLQEALDRKEELASALSDLQYRQEDARTLLIRTTSERDQAAATAASAITRMTEGANRESALRNERSELKKELDEANLRLLTHSNPERAELESLRQAVSQANAEKATMAKRLEQARKDSDFFRSQYQDASNTASREVAANTDLRNQLALATNRATGEQSKLRQMGYDARTKQLEDENKKLKVVLKDRDAGLNFRDEEIAKLKEASRGRMGTRGTSVPRSSRLASPMGGGRSRQGSPAVGELKGKGSLLHPLRNNA